MGDPWRGPGSRPGRAHPVDLLELVEDRASRCFASPGKRLVQDVLSATTPSPPVSLHALDADDVMTDVGNARALRFTGEKDIEGLSSRRKKNAPLCPYSC